MPAALPPAAAAPLGIFAGAFALGVLANLAVQALLGLINPPKDQGQPILPGNGEYWLEGYKADSMATWMRITTNYAGGPSFVGNAPNCIPQGSFAGYTFSSIMQGIVNAKVLIQPSLGGCGTPGLEVEVTLFNGSKQKIHGYGIGKDTQINGSHKITIVPLTTTTGPAFPPLPRSDPFPRPPVPAFDPLPDYEPAADPEEEKSPAPPLPLAPPIAPAVPTPAPGSNPLAPPGPGPGSTPAPYAPGTGTGTSGDPNRRLVPGILPLQVPSPTPRDETAPNIDNGTTTVRPQTPTTPQTAPGTEVTPDGQIGQPGTAPPATMEGIAAEVGRIEQKTRQLLNRPAPELDLGSITDLIQLLINLLQQIYGPGSYSLSAPCEEGGSAVVGWSGGFGAFGQVNVKLDALADLLQAHKDMRQPICAQKASGEEVTVVFEEI